MPDPFDQSSPGGQDNIWQNLMNFGAATMANSAGQGAVTGATAIGKGLLSAQESARANTKGRAENQELQGRAGYYGSQNYLASMQGKVIENQLKGMQLAQDAMNEQTEPSSTAQSAPQPRDPQGMTGPSWVATPGSTRLNSGNATNAYPAGSSGEPAPREASFMPPMQQGSAFAPPSPQDNSQAYTPITPQNVQQASVAMQGGAGNLPPAPGIQIQAPAPPEMMQPGMPPAVGQLPVPHPQAVPNPMAPQQQPQGQVAGVQQPQQQAPGSPPLFNRAKLAKLGLIGTQYGIPGLEKLGEQVKPPANYEMAKNGDYQAIHGGAEDTSVIQRKKEAEEMASETAKTASGLQKDYMEGNNNALQVKASLNQMGNVLKDMSPGKISDFKKAIADWKITAGVGTDEDKKFTASTQVFDKETARLAVETLKQFTARGTQMEFKTFLANNPNSEMTPQGIRTMLGFMQKSAQRDIDRYQAFQDYRKQATSANDTMNFPALWAQHLAENPKRYTQDLITDNQEQAYAKAKAAIAKGYPRKQIIQGLQAVGFDASGL